MAGPAEQQWFRLADQDGDGAVGGAEAVAFFTRSGLPQDVLGQIWEYASAGAPKLAPMQFSVALRLVALAQASGGRLAPDQARLVVMGGGPQLPAPRLAGLTDIPPTPSIPTYTPQITGLTPQVTGAAGYAPGGYAPQMTGGRPPMAPPGGYPQQQQQYASGPPSGSGALLTGASSGSTMPGAAAAAGPTGGVGVPAPAGALPPGYPPPTPADLARYAAVFAATDGDRDGYVRGSECFPVFMQSGLDKGRLKAMWDLVGGPGAGALNQAQFAKCMFLMDGMRRGLALPSVLPPGPWPLAASPIGAGPTGHMPPQPIGAGFTGSGPPSAGLTGAAAAAAAGLTGASPRSSWGGGGAAGGAAAGGQPLPAESWSLSSQFGGKGAVKSVYEAYDQTLPRIPEPPGRVQFEGLGAAPEARPSMAPDLDATVSSMLAPADKERWEAERAEALKREQEQRAAEAEAANQKARLALFQQALSELVMFKSRVDVALLQASDSAARLTAEAEDLEARYTRAQLASQSQAEAGSKARKQLQDLLAKKQEAQNKLTLLAQELEMAQHLNPEELVALEREVGLLVSQVAASEAKKAALDMQLDSGRQQKELLAGRIQELDMAAAAGESELRRARDELGTLQSKVLTAQASALMPEELGEVAPLLGKAASAYRRLYSTAAAAGLDVPYEANLSNVGSLVWLEQLMAGTADWVDDENALAGYSVVNALPDLDGVPPSILRAAAIAAAAQPAIKPAAVIDASAAPAASAAAAEAAAGTTESASKDGAAAAAPPEAAAAASSDAVQQEQPAKEPADAAAASAAEAPAAAAAGGGKKGKKKAAAAAAAAAAGAAAAAATAAAAGASDVQEAAPSAGEAPAASAADSTAAEAAQQAAADLPASLEEAAAHDAADGAAATAAAAAAPAAVAAPPVSAASMLHADSDSDAMSPPPPSSGDALPGGFGGLPGFDPSLYRLPGAQEGGRAALAQQHSFDSSVAGSFTGERRGSLDVAAGLTGGSAAAAAAAGATGSTAVGGFDEPSPAFGVVTGGSSAGGDARRDSSAGGASGGGAADDALGFEDNAF